MQFERCIKFSAQFDFDFSLSKFCLWMTVFTIFGPNHAKLNISDYIPLRKLKVSQEGYLTMLHRLEKKLLEYGRLRKS